MNRLILAPGSTFTLGASSIATTVFGTVGGNEVLTIGLGANVILDASFNRGGDIINLAGNAASYSAVRSGSSIILTDAAGSTITIPVGTTAMTINFADTSRSLVFDTQSSSVKLGIDTVDGTRDPLTAGPVGNSVDLTAGADTATANVFNAPVVLVAGTGYLNTLNDFDKLTGTGTSPTLNVVLAASNDIRDSGSVQPTLNGIAVINAEWNSAETRALNLADADSALTTVNITRITQNNPNVAVADIGESVRNLSLSNATRGGNVLFAYREDILTGNADSVNLTLNAVRVNNLVLAQGFDSIEDTGYGFETVNIRVTGASDVDRLQIEQNFREDNSAANASQTINLTADRALEVNDLVINGAENLNIQANADIVIARSPALVLGGPSNDGITSPQLRSVTIAGAGNVSIDGLDGHIDENNILLGDRGGTLTVAAGSMTGALKLGIETPSDSNLSSVYASRNDKDLVVTSGSGNDEIVTYGNLAGDITTNAGNDKVTIGSPGAADAEGVSTIDTGAGNDSVRLGDLLVTAGDQDKDANDGFDDVFAARVLTGDGDDTVSASVLRSGKDYDNLVTEENNNADDVYKIIGSRIETGAGDDAVTVIAMEENTLIDTGSGSDTLNIAASGITLLAADTAAGVEVASVNSDKTTVADVLGARVTMGTGNDTANFVEASSKTATNLTTILGAGAQLDGGDGTDVMNVKSLDAIVVGGNAASITGIETLNLTVQNQVLAATAAISTLTENDNVATDGRVEANIASFDAALGTINLVSEERVTRLNDANERYEAGTSTEFTLQNLRTGIAVNLTANEATGVTSGSLVDDMQLVLNGRTAAATANAGAMDVQLNIGMNVANQDLILNVTPNSQAIDIGLTATAATHIARTVTFNLADTNSHSIDANGYDGQAFLVKTAAGAGKTIAVDELRATEISFLNAAGTGVTSANVQLRVAGKNGVDFDSAQDNYVIITGSGTDVLDMRRDTVRSDETLAGRLKDVIDTGRGRDTMIVSGDNNLSSNDLVAGATQLSTIINDDVFEDINGLEIITVDTDFLKAPVMGTVRQQITLDEAAKETGIDTINFVGSVNNHAVSLVIGNNFNVSTRYNPETGANGETLSTPTALVLDADLHTKNFVLDIDNKDDDSALDQVNLDIRVNAKNGTAVNFFDTGNDDQVVQVQVRLSEGVANEVSARVDGADNGEARISVNGPGSIDRVVLASTPATYLTAVVSDKWTRNNGSFEFDGSAVTLTGTAVSLPGGEGNPDFKAQSFIRVEDANLGDVVIKGTKSADYIVGSLLDNSSINGNEGADMIVGGRVSDVLVGGAGIFTDVLQGERIEAATGQISTLTFGTNYDKGDIITVTFNGTNYTHTVATDGAYTFSASNFTGLQAALTAANVTVATNGGVATFTDNDKGVTNGAFTVAASVTDVAITRESYSFSPTKGIGKSWTVTVGTQVFTTASPTANGSEENPGGMDDRLQALATQINNSAYASTNGIQAVYNPGLTGSDGGTFTVRGPASGASLASVTMQEGTATIVPGTAQTVIFTVDGTDGTDDGSGNNAVAGNMTISGGWFTSPITVALASNNSASDADLAPDFNVPAVTALYSVSVTGNQVTLTALNAGAKSALSFNFAPTAGGTAQDTVVVAVSPSSTNGTDATVNVTGTTLTSTFVPGDITVNSLDPLEATTQVAADSTVVIAQDTLTGGDGNDVFVILGGKDSTGDGRMIYDRDPGTAVVEVQNFDTITDLNLGGNGTNVADRIGLDFAITRIVNGNVPVAMSGATLVQAVNSLFQNGGVFDYVNSNAEAKNAAGLFTWGGDTYLIATGEDNSAPGFGADDVIIKVTGMTGTISTDDFVLNYSGYNPTTLVNNGVAMVNYNDVNFTFA